MLSNDVCAMYQSCCISLSGLVVHPSALFASSCAIASCGAQLTKTPLFLHLANIVPPALCPPITNSANQRGSKPKLKFTMPIPVVSALAGGQLLIGKLRFREFCMTPLSGSPFPEQIKMLTQVHTELGKAVQVKAGVSLPEQLEYCANWLSDRVLTTVS